MANRLTPAAPAMTEREAVVACSALKIPFRPIDGEDLSHPSVALARKTFEELCWIERKAGDPYTALAEMRAYLDGAR